MPVFRLVSASDSQAFMDTRPTIRMVTVVIHTVTIRRIFDRLSIIAQCLGLIIGGMANAYFCGITISGIKHLAAVAKHGSIPCRGGIALASA
jgi:hypothetical protein